MQIVLVIVITIGALLLSLVLAGWMMKRASEFIVRDLRQKAAFDPASAVELPYATSSLFRLGFRDYRPKALAMLVQMDQVRVHEGRYYLREGHKLDGSP